MPEIVNQINLLFITPDALKLIEQCARTCYRSEDKISDDTAEELIKRLIKSGHHSVLEHAHATFEIIGSRAFTHQLVRHRLASFCQESQRYVVVSDFDYIVPQAIKQIENTTVGELLGNEINVPIGYYYHCIMKELSNNYSVLMDCMQAAVNKGLLDSKNFKEDARFVLPNACASKIVITANFREWRHILLLRCDRKAQWEIRNVMKSILQTLYSYYPFVFEDVYEKLA